MFTFFQILKIVLPLGILGALLVFVIGTLKKSKDSDPRDSYMAEGIGLGLVFGGLMASALSIENLGLVAGIGMVLGLVIGQKIKKAN